MRYIFASDSMKEEEEEEEILFCQTNKNKYTHSK